MTLLRWLIFLLRSLTVTLTALLDLFISSGTSICSTMAFPTLEISDHVVVSVSIDSLTNSKRDTPFHRIGYEYSHDSDTLDDSDTLYLFCLLELTWNCIIYL